MNISRLGLRSVEAVLVTFMKYKIVEIFKQLVKFKMVPISQTKGKYVLYHSNLSFSSDLYCT